MRARGFAIIALLVMALGRIVTQNPVEAQPLEAEGTAYRIFIPHIAKAASTPYFGLALAVDEPADLARLHSTWYYNWSDQGTNNAVEYVPMAYSGKTNRLQRGYNGYLLVFNEPNLPPPNGCNLTPQEAAARYGQLRMDFPDAKMVVGGWSVFAKDWARDFVNELKAQDIPLPERWHVHAYTEEWITPAKAKEFLLYYQNLTGGTYWITEFGSPAGKLDDFKSMTTWFSEQTWIERVAAYTNRQPGNAAWAIGAGVELVKDDATLTNIGAYYADQSRKKSGK